MYNYYIMAIYTYMAYTEVGVGCGISYAPAMLVARLRAKKPAVEPEAAPKAAAKAAA